MHNNARNLFSLSAPAVDKIRVRQIEPSYDSRLYVGIPMSCFVVPATF